MKKGTKIIVTVFAMVMVLSTMVVGIWAASVQVANFGATVSFSANDVAFTFVGDWEGSLTTPIPFNDPIDAIDDEDALDWNINVEFNAATKTAITIYYAFHNRTGAAIDFTIVTTPMYDFDAGSQVTVETAKKVTTGYSGDYDLESLKEADCFTGLQTVTNGTGLTQTNVADGAVYAFTITLTNNNWLSSILSGEVEISFGLTIERA